jgi:UDP-2,4-diacetamido-2,4,6-trideoxy-beta-L-altropyranose hydrolase
MMGGGHLMRCIALAEACAEFGMEPIFASEALSAADHYRISSRGFKHRPMPPIEQQPEALAAMSGRGLVVDRYGLVADYLAPWQASERPSMQIVDDEKPLSGLSLALNQNLAASIDEHPGTKRLCGLRYALLRSEFRNALPVDSLARVERVLLTLGAADPQGHTLDFIDMLRPVIIERKMKLCLVIGGHNRQAESLRRQAVHSDWLEIYENVENMAELMASCQLAVSSAGSTLWELCAMGLPRLVSAIAPNQRALASAASAHGAAIDLGEVEQLFAASVVADFERLIDDQEARHTQIQAGRRLVDGQGALRVAAAWKEML